MIDPNKKPDTSVNPSDVCYRAFELIGAKQYSDAEKLLASNMSRTDDDASIALYHSVMGVLFKVQGEFKTAWKHYQRAEKLLPDDPALKIISARLMIDQFAQYSSAIKKAKKVLELIPGNAVFEHQAYSTIGLAHFRKGERKKAVTMLETSWGEDFKGFVTAKNVDFELVEALTRRGWGLESCRTFISKAYDYAVTTGEEPFVSLFDRMLTAFDGDYPDVVSETKDPLEEF
jgi:tetratricopeptide (TPR) repeat protein